MIDKQKKATLKNVMKGLNKASKSHANQAKKIKKVINQPQRKKK